MTCPSTGIKGLAVVIHPDNGRLSDIKRHMLPNIRGMSSRGSLVESVPPDHSRRTGRESGQTALFIDVNILRHDVFVQSAISLRAVFSYSSEYGLAPDYGY